MDELPELLVEAVGDGTVIGTVALGGGDVVAVANENTYLYRSEGLLSDESVEAFGHDVERFAVDGGRRKSVIRLAIVDDERDFAVPSKVADDVVVAMLEGVLRTTGVVDDAETILATFRFSELTLVVTAEQLLKHVGGAVWDDEYEAFGYGDLTRLEFEEGSVATQVVLQADGRQQRVKVPNDHAGRVREDIQSAVFEYHDVSSLGGLHAAIEPDVDPDADDNDDASGDGSLESQIDVEADGDAAHDTDSDSADTDTIAKAGAPADTDAGSDGADQSTSAGRSAGNAGDTDRDDGFVSADWSPPADQDITGPSGAVGNDAGSAAGTSTAAASTEGSSGRDGTGQGDGGADVEALAEHVEALTERIDRQNDLLASQQDTIERLVDELRRGR